MMRGNGGGGREGMGDGKKIFIKKKKKPQRDICSQFKKEYYPPPPNRKGCIIIDSIRPLSLPHSSKITRAKEIHPSHREDDIEKLDKSGEEAGNDVHDHRDGIVPSVYTGPGGGGGEYGTLRNKKPKINSVG